MPVQVQTGTGAWIFTPLVIAMSLLLGLVVPMLSASGIAAERERGTLSLVLLTGIGRRQFIVQLWLGQAAQGATLLLIALPVLALAYTYGGITATQLWSTIAGLAQLILQGSAIGIACGCWCRDVASGVVSAIAYLALLYLLVPIPMAIAEHLLRIPVDAVAFSPLALVAWSDALTPSRMVEDLVLPLVPVWCALHLSTKALRRGKAAGLAPHVRRTFGTSGGLQDRWVRRRGWVSSSSIPSDQPVAWRERHRGTSAGSLMIKVMVALAAPVGFFQLFTPVGIGYIALLIVGIFISAFAAAGLIPSERATGNLEVLLSTPLSAGEIIRQKASARRGVILRISLVLGLVAIMHLSIGGMLMPRVIHVDRLLLEAAAELSAAILLPMGAFWIGMWAGMRSASFQRAIILACSCCAGVFVVPLLAWVFLSADGALAPILQALTPLHLLLSMQRGSLRDDHLGEALVFALLLWPFTVFTLRSWCLIITDRLTSCHGSVD